MVTRRHVITNGPLKGKNIQDYIVLTTQYGPYFLSQWGKVLDVPVKPNFKGLEALKQSLQPLADKALKTGVSIEVKRKDGQDLANVYVNPL